MPQNHSRIWLSLCAVFFCAAPTAAQTVLTIPQIQGAGHASPYVGTFVKTSGVITARASNGFYFQDPLGDGNDATSDGLFVFTSSSPSSILLVGDTVEVTGNVVEFLPGANNLRLTEISATGVTETGTGLITPTVIGSTGRLQPTSVIDNDSFSVFDPASDGIDFYESLEGMLVQMPNAVATAPRNSFGEIWAVPDNGTSATGFNSRGGITISSGDFNPERLQIDDAVGVGTPSVLMGDHLGNVTGVIGYSFGSFELNLTSPIAPQSGGLTAEQSSIVGRRNRLTVASYNVLNLDPFDSPSLFTAQAQQIVNKLNAPDILALQEVQDNSGPIDDGTTSASATYGLLIDAIEDAGGPTYAYAEIAPPAPNIDGGEPGGNIRVGYLYNPDRVELKPGSLVRHGDSDSAFNSSRKPLEATFIFNGQEIVLIDNHFTAKGGTPLYGSLQPPTDGGLSQRNSQAAYLNALVDAILAGEPDARVLVLGDLNSFPFESPHDFLRGGVIDPVLFNLNEQLELNERYSYNFEGNSQQLDHMYATAALLALAEFDAVHVNTGFLQFASDHDPLLASFYLPVPEPISGALLAIVGPCLALRTRRRTEPRRWY